MPGRLRAAREFHIVPDSDRAREARLRSHHDVVAQAAVVGNLDKRIEMAMVPNFCRRNEPGRHDTVGAKTTSVTDDDSCEVRHHPAFASIHVKAVASASHDRTRLENAFPANLDIRINRDVRLEHATVSNLGVSHYDATGPNNDILA